MVSSLTFHPKPQNGLGMVPHSSEVNPPNSPMFVCRDISLLFFTIYHLVNLFSSAISVFNPLLLLTGLMKCKKKKLVMKKVWQDSTFNLVCKMLIAQ